MNVIKLSNDKILPENQSDEEKEKLINSRIYSETINLVCEMKMLSKEQLWQYFSDIACKDAVSHIINKLIKDKALYIANPDNICSAKTQYVTDERMLSPEYYKTRPSKGVEDSFGNAENFKQHMKDLNDHMYSFWVFLDFKQKHNACSPVSINGDICPFVILGFFMNDELWEVLKINPGEEKSCLSILSTKEKYSENKYANKRIVIIEDEKQIDIIKKYNINNICLYAVMEENGDTKYIRAA